MGKLGESRQVVAVQQDRNGYCAIAKRTDYPASVPYTFKELCQQAGLPLPPILTKTAGGPEVRQTQTEGTTLMEMDFPPLEDLAQQDFGPDFFGNLDTLLPADYLEKLLVVGLAGGGGVLVATNAVEYLGGWLSTKDNKVAQALAGPEGRSAMMVVTGVLLGRLAYKEDDESRRAAAYAVVASVSGLGLARLVSALAARFGLETQIHHSLSAAEVANVPPDEFFSPTRGALPQIGQVDVMRDDPLALGSPEVEVDELSLASWMG